MAALSAKAQRQAAPIEKLPWRVTRKYGEPTLQADVSNVRTLIRRDLDELEELGRFWGDQLDRAAIDAARSRIGAWYQGHLTIEFVFDLHTGTKYSVQIQDRRIP
jgi:hypothetical protein